MAVLIVQNCIIFILIFTRIWKPFVEFARYKMNIIIFIIIPTRQRKKILGILSKTYKDYRWVLEVQPTIFRTFAEFLSTLQTSTHNLKMPEVPNGL